MAYQIDIKTETATGTAKTRTWAHTADEAEGIRQSYRAKMPKGGTLTIKVKEIY